MKPAEQVADFVGRALEQGRSRDEVAGALRGAGWAEAEVARAMGSWAEGGFSPPVPRPRSYVSAREAFVYGALFVALGFATWYIVDLGIVLIDMWFDRDGTDYYSDSYRLRELRWSIAVLIVTVPLFLWLNRRQAKAMAADPASRRSAIRKWTGYFTLFLSLLTMAGNVIYAIYSLLDGDFTLQFAAKVTLVMVVAGLVFLYYRLEAEDADAT